jgi:hypothetical protein
MRCAARSRPCRRPIRTSTGYCRDRPCRSLRTTAGFVSGCYGRPASGMRFFSLQQGEPAGDPLVQRLGMTCLSPHTTRIEAAAAAMCALDLVISIDGMPAHLAGTLGRPTWVLLKHEADWRWMQDRPDSPWYPTMHLFRQPREGDWSGVVRQLTAALRPLAHAHAHRKRQALSAAVLAR